MLKNKKLKMLAQQYIDKYKLTLAGYNVLVPVIETEPVLPGLIASMAGADNIYLFDPTININSDKEVTCDGHSFTAKYIGSLSDEVLRGLNIILKSPKIALRGDKVGLFAKDKAVISLFPENLDFLSTQGLDMEALNEEKLTLIGINPEDSKFGLYQQISHLILKKCYNLGIDVFKSKILLVGNGSFLNTTLSMFKYLGATVYAYNTTSEADQSYILKHLKELDAIIVMDYPQTENQILGSKGVISICDIVDQCKLVKVLHIAGNTETGSLKLGNISYYPETIPQDGLNLNIKELGERGIVELAVASLKIAENFLTLGKKSLTSNETGVTYKVLNSWSFLQ